jgi:hypothetical protein
MRMDMNANIDGILRPMLKTGSLPIVLLGLMGFFLNGCAALGLNPESSDYIDIQPSDRVFLQVEPFGPIVRDELTQAGLDPDKVHGDLVSELRYQNFLKKQEEARDSAEATVRVNVVLEHLQPGNGNIGTLIGVTLTSQRDEDGKPPLMKKVRWESHHLVTENVPAEFLAQDVPRTTAEEILGHMQRPPPAPQPYNGLNMVNNPSITPLR